VDTNICLVINEKSLLHDPWSAELLHSHRAVHKFNVLFRNSRIYHDKVFQTTLGVWSIRFFSALRMCRTREQCARNC